MLNVCPAPSVWFQVMVRCMPIAQELPLAGAVTVIVPEIVKLTLLMSLSAPFADALTRIRACVVAGPVTTQLYAPEPLPFGALAATALQVVPPSRLTSMFTVCAASRLVFQVIDCVLPVAQVTAVFGAV